MGRLPSFAEKCRDLINAKHYYLDGEYARIKFDVQEMISFTALHALGRSHDDGSP